MLVACLEGVPVALAAPAPGIVAQGAQEDGLPAQDHSHALHQPHLCQLCDVLHNSSAGCSSTAVRTGQYRYHHSTVQYSTVQYGTVRFSAIPCSTVQYSTMQYSTVQCDSVQYSAVQCSTVQSNAVQYSTVQSSPVQYSPLLFCPQVNLDFFVSPVHMICWQATATDTVAIPATFAATVTATAMATATAAAVMPYLAPGQPNITLSCSFD